MAISKIIYKSSAEAEGEVWMDVTQKTVTSGTMLSGTTAMKNDGTDITGNIATKTSADLSASGATVTVPAGYYETDASKSVASGSATTPATSITANPSISVSSGGLITASVSASQSVTPTVSAGYVSSGTSGTVSVSGSDTEQLTTQAAQTIHPSTTDQTIASGKYLTGAQTVKGVLLTNLDAGNIKKDVVVKIGDSTDDDCVTSVTGTFEGGTTPSGVKYILTSMHGRGAWDVSGYQYCSVDGAPLNDGHMRMGFDLTEETDPFSLSMTFGFNRTQGTIVTDWGDGSTPTTTTKSSFTSSVSHTYSLPGYYVVDVTFVSGAVQLYSTSSAWSTRLTFIEARALSPTLINGVNFPTFSNCSKLISIYYGSECNTPGAVSGNPLLKYVTLPSAITDIRASMCYNLPSLETITIPQSVTSIGDGAFYQCTSLKEVHLLPTAPPTINYGKGSGSSPFASTPDDMVLYVPVGYLTAYQSATNWSTYASQMQEESS